MTLAYSFMDHPKNKSWVELCCVELFGRLDSHPQRATEWTNGSRINPNAIRTYLNIRQDFLSALSVAIYLTAGQPPRRTEEQILRWRNTSLGGLQLVPWSFNASNDHFCVVRPVRGGPSGILARP